MTVESLPEFFERYLDAWNTPEQLPTFYAEPFIAARLGQTQLNATRLDTQRFFDNVLAKYRSRGFASAKLLSFSERPLGVNSALATVRWAYQDHGGDTIWTWTFSYNTVCAGRSLADHSSNPSRRVSSREKSLHKWSADVSFW